MSNVLDNLKIGEIYFKSIDEPWSMKYTGRGKWFTRGIYNNYISEKDINGGKMDIDQLINDSEWTYYFSTDTDGKESYLFKEKDLANIITKEEYEKLNQGSVTSYNRQYYMQQITQPGGKFKKSIRRNVKKRSTRQKIQKYFFR